MVSPIENLRNQEAQIESSSRYNEFKEGGSAFRPWSPAAARGSVPLGWQSFFVKQKSNEQVNKKMSALSGNRLYPNHSSCGCCPTSPLYMNCRQCKTAAQAGCPSSVNIYHNDRHGDSDIKPKLDLGVNPNSCNCEQCKKNISNINELESSFDDIIKNCTSGEMKLTTSSRDLAQLLSSEIKRLNISQDDKIREISVSKQRLQTELHLIKMESQKKLKEARDTKAHVEQELETLHRERQKVSLPFFIIILLISCVFYS